MTKVDRRIRLAFAIDALAEAELCGLPRGNEQPYGEAGYSGFGAILFRAMRLGAVPWRFAYEVDRDEGDPYCLADHNGTFAVEYKHAQMFGLAPVEYEGLVEASQVREDGLTPSFGEMRAALVDGTIASYLVGARVAGRNESAS